MSYLRFSAGLETMVPNQDMPGRSEVAAGSAGNVGRRLRFDPRVPWVLLKHSPQYARQLLRVEGPGLLKVGFKHSTHWAHPIAALFAFATDVVKPILPHCTAWVFVGALVLLVCLLVMMRLKKITVEVGGALIAFCLMTALLSVAVIGLQKITGGEEEGAFAKLIPGIEELQKKLGLVETKLDLIQQSQQQETARAEARHAEEMERLKALDERQKAVLEALAREKGVPIAALVQMLARLGETVISNDPAEVERRLAQKADEYLALRQEVLSLSGDDPRVRALQNEADMALGNSDFALARGKLHEAADIDRAASLSLAERAKTRALAAAQSLEGSARVATLTLHCRDAADDFSKAGAIVAPFDRKLTWRLMAKQAAALASQGDEFGDNDSLVEAVLLYNQVLNLIMRTEDTMDWVRNQTSLGNVLTRLGERDSSSTHLEEAVAAYRSALEVATPDLMPLDWARTQHNLGDALMRLGERDSSSAHSEEAIVAYRSALEVWKRDRMPLDWAHAQMGIGDALETLGEHEAGTAHLEEAIVVYRSALEATKRDPPSRLWTHLQNNLGNALEALGEREAGTARLEEAVSAYRLALEVTKRDQLPVDWATIQVGLAGGLSAIGKREAGTARLEEAIVAYRLALEEITRGRMPFNWSLLQNNLGLVLEALGKRAVGTARLEEAVSAYRLALDVTKRDQLPVDWARAQLNLSNTLGEIGEREAGTARLEEAIAGYRLVLEVTTRDRMPFKWAQTQMNLGLVLFDLGKHEVGTAHLEEAVEAWNACLSIIGVPSEWIEGIRARQVDARAEIKRRAVQ